MPDSVSRRQAEGSRLVSRLSWDRESRREDKGEDLEVREETMEWKSAYGEREGEGGEEEEMRERRAWLGMREGRSGRGSLVTGQVRWPESSQRWMEDRSNVCPEERMTGSDMISRDIGQRKSSGRASMWKKAGFWKVGVERKKLLSLSTDVGCSGLPFSRGKSGWI